jgi:hypothetical protein
LSDNFSIQNGLKQGHALSLFDIALEYAIKINIDKTKYMLLSRHQNQGKIMTDVLEMWHSSDIWERL